MKWWNTNENNYRIYDSDIKRICNELIIKEIDTILKPVEINFAQTVLSRAFCMIWNAKSFLSDT